MTIEELVRDWADRNGVEFTEEEIHGIVERVIVYIKESDLITDALWAYKHA